MLNRAAQDLHLTKEEYLQGKVHWLVNDPEAWDWMCEWWASTEFRALLNKNN
jgi:hypothetical protein